MRSSRAASVLIAVIGAGLVSTGCCTTYTLMEPAEGVAEFRVPRIYGGTVLSSVLTWVGLTSGGADSIALMFIADVPFSLAADTVALPYTVSRSITEDPWLEPAERPKPPVP